MLDNIKNILIAVAITALVTGIATSSITWKYTSSHYKEVIATAKEEAATSLQKATDKVLLAERKNNDITAELNKKALEHDKQLAAAQTELDKYRVSNRRLQFRADSCSAKPVADSSSSGVVGGAASPSDGVCILPESASEAISYTFAAADQMRDTLLICKEYAEQIEAQRKQMSIN